MEGKKFYAHYDTKDWELSRGLIITNWNTAVNNFFEKGFKIKKEYTRPISNQIDNLRKYEYRNKGYGIPIEFY